MTQDTIMINNQATPNAGELAACPFCGEQPTMQEYRSESDETGEVYGYAAVECNKHGSEGGVFFHCETLAEAITAWNTRAKETPTSASPTPRGEVD